MIKVLLMSFFINAVQEDAFRSVVDYFKGRNMKIIASNSTSYAVAEFGSWFSMFPGNAKGNVEARLVKRNGGSYVNLNFSFFLYYLGGLLIGVIGATIIYGFIEWLATTNPLRNTNFPAAAPWFALSNSVICIIGVILLLAYDVSKTRKNFIEEFNMFVQSLASKKE
jgi:uncharacterized membrane protein YidH (DUF202 family)